MEEWYWVHAAHEVRPGLWASAIKVTWPKGNLHARYLPDWGHHDSETDALAADVALAMRFAAERNLPRRVNAGAMAMGEGGRVVGRSDGQSNEP